MCIRDRIWYSYEDRKLEKKINLQTPEECLYNLTLLSTTTNKSLSRISQQLVEQSAKNEEYYERLNTTISQQSKILEQFINDFVKRMDDIFTEMHGPVSYTHLDVYKRQPMDIIPPINKAILPQKRFLYLEIT